MGMPQIVNETGFFGLAESLLGNTIYANVLMLGYAWQKGLVPVSRRS